MQSETGSQAPQALVDSYGDATAEYWAARDEAGFLELSRGVLEVTGPGRLKFLQRMLSNDVAGRQPGQGCRAALLTPKGGVEALLRVLVENDRVALETEADRLSMLQQTLEHHRVAAPVRFARRPAAVLAVIGLRADRVVAAAEGAIPPGEGESHVGGTVADQRSRVARAGDLPNGGLVLHVAPESATAVRERLRSAGARPVGRAALDALRIEALRPWYGSDVTEANLLHETGLLAECHSSTKGCYLGQEVVARLAARGGNVNKALRGLKLTTASRAGETITAGGREIGRVTTAAVSPRLGPIAMGYVHRSHLAAGTVVEVAGAPAAVVTSFEG